MAKIGKIVKGIGMGSLGVVSFACGAAINVVAGPYSKLMGDSSPFEEAKENSKYLFEEAKNSFIDAFDD